MKLMVRACMGVVLALAIPACPPPGGGGTTGGGGRGTQGGVAVNPDGCGTINTNPVGRKLYAFLVASAELDKTSFELENTVKGACQKMARDLGVADTGDTRTVCMAAK